MCLIAIADRVSDDLPFVLAANRDEDYDRPTHDAHPWAGAEDIVGGRDALYGGSWLAVRRGGRFAAVTNLRGAERRKRSRGFLVRDFVAGAMDADAYAGTIARDAHDYAGFHLLAGNVAGDGTRSSAVVVATRTEILFAEQTFARGGVALGDRRLFCLVR